MKCSVLYGLKRPIGGLPCVDCSENHGLLLGTVPDAAPIILNEMTMSAMEISVLGGCQHSIYSPTWGALILGFAI